MTRLTMTGDSLQVRQPSGKLIRKYYYRCSCGDVSLYFKDNVIRGKVTKCYNCRGNNVNIPTEKVMKGKSKHPLYKVWKAIKSRCFRVTDHNYVRYGGRGITVCDRWLNSFENFLEDMGERPSKDYSVGRVDNNGNYEPSNCRWATRSEQANNIRKKVSISDHTGVYYKRSTDSWYANLSIDGKNYNVGSSKDKAIAILYRKTAELWYYGFNKA